MKTKHVLSIVALFSMICSLNAQKTWDFKTGTDGWTSYGADYAVSHDGSDKLMLALSTAGDGTIDYPTIYVDYPLDVSTVNYFHMKFNATNWPKTNVLVNVYFELPGGHYYANQTMNVASGEFSFHIRNQVQHTWNVLPATGTASRIRIELPHNSELAGSNWNGTTISIDEISFLYQLTTGLNESTDSRLSVYPNPAMQSFGVNGGTFDQLNIYDATGKLLKSVTKSSENVSVSDFARGLYFVEIQSNGQKSIEKLIVK
jgi:hypothetical protein